MTPDQMRQEAYRLLDEADSLDPPPIPDWLAAAMKPVTAESLRESTEFWSRIYEKAMQ
jgi:hypothetical protein